MLFWSRFLKASGQFTDIVSQWSPKELCIPAKDWEVGGCWIRFCGWEESRKFLKWYFHQKIEIYGDIPQCGFCTTWKKTTSSAIENLFLCFPYTVIPTFAAQIMLLQISRYRGNPHKVTHIFKERTPTKQGAAKLQNGLKTLFCPLILKVIILTQSLVWYSCFEFSAEDDPRSTRSLSSLLTSPLPVLSVVLMG